MHMLCDKVPPQLPVTTALFRYFSPHTTQPMGKILISCPQKTANLHKPPHTAKPVKLATLVSRPSVTVGHASI
jgi:hypothetical protein